MDLDRLVEDVRLLAHGVDPETRHEFPLDSPYQRPRVIRALMAASHALEEERSTLLDERRVMARRVEEMLVKLSVLEKAVHA